MLLHEFNNFALGAVAIVSVGLGQEGAMTAMFSFNKLNMRIGGYFCAALRKNADKRIVLGVYDKSRHMDAVKHARPNCAMIIVIPTAKARIRCRNQIIS